MTLQWLPGAQVVDLSGSRGNGPFEDFRGVCLHVNVSGPTSEGTSIEFFKTNAGQVTSNFQVYRNGDIVQFLPLDWQPWCQRDGNYNYSAIETGGDPDMPLTVAQLQSCARIYRAYHDEMGAPYQTADVPGQRGLITHQAGGGAWGGHACPGPIRTAQRGTILSLAAGNTPPPPEEEISMADIQKILDQIEDVKRLVRIVINGRAEDPDVAGTQRVEGLAQQSANYKALGESLKAMQADVDSIKAQLEAK